MNFLLRGGSAFQLAREGSSTESRDSKENTQGLEEIDSQHHNIRARRHSPVRAKRHLEIRAIAQKSHHKRGVFGMSLVYQYR